MSESELYSRAEKRVDEKISVYSNLYIRYVNDKILLCLGYIYFNS